MEADGASFTPLPLSVRFMGIQSYGYTDQRKVETDVEVTEDRTGDLSLRKPRTSQLSHDCSLVCVAPQHFPRLSEGIPAFLLAVAIIDLHIIFSLLER